MSRRLLVALVVALCASGSAAAASVRTAADPLEAQEWWLADVGVDPAAAPGPGIPITIVDSGVDPSHPEFAGRPNTTFLNAQTVSGRDEFHGTIVASVAAAPENGIGIVGIYPTATLQAYDASPDTRGIVTFTASAGILAAAAHCPGVINLSFGGTQQDAQLHDAILTAVHNGCLVVAAAGNDGDSGNPPTYPADWAHVFTVGATDPNDVAADFTTSSPAVDVAAPGTMMVGAVPLSRDPSGFEIALAGTSFSAPIVSAAAAWIWTLRPTLTAAQVADAIRSSARDVGAPGFEASTGWGIVNLPAALAAPVGPADTSEPNDDVPQIKPGRLFSTGEPPLSSPAKPALRVSGTIDRAEDPRDVYRIWVPAKKVVRVSVSAGGDADARIWGPKTVSVNEGVAARRRDLKGARVRGDGKGFEAYVEVLLTGRSPRARYVLSVRAARR